MVSGVPLDFIIPVFNEPASVSRILYHVSVIVVGTYIGFIGLRELFIEKRFSVEFLMAIAALGQYISIFCSKALPYSFFILYQNIFEDFIEDRARKTIEKLSQFMPEEAR